VDIFLQTGGTGEAGSLKVCGFFAEKQAGGS
jgi:hypothetical protein